MKGGRNIPVATYRLQFHRNFTLQDARALVPYLRELGVTHLYASPLLMARPGSQHGYDVCDPTRLNPELGTDADLEALIRDLHQNKMGLVLDVVPNHMATAPENPWWWDVLQKGQASAFAGYFDIDWNVPDPQLNGKILVPVLGDELECVIERGELRVACENNEVVVRYYEHRFPASPGSLVVPEKTPEQFVCECNADRDVLAKFLDRQHYLLAFWRRGHTQLNYRRFFNIVDLAAVRVELPQVFADSHNRILDWYQRGWIDGLRIDHPDGLRDPEDYFQRLRHAAPDAWITVEKILGSDETLPDRWPVAGTTGYDFLDRVTGVFINPAGEKPLTDFYAEFTGEPTGYHAVVREKKRLVLGRSLVAEIERLLRLLRPLAAADARVRDSAEADLREALVELVACFPVYRTYIRAAARAVSAQDIRWINDAVQRALQQQPALGNLFDFLRDVLLLKTQADDAVDFVLSFQQLTGPAMAKGVEDTTFYCFNRLIALNVVGGEPGSFGLSVEKFHESCEFAQAHWPHAMLATSTHDTKRSEDVRARLCVLSEIPAQWSATVRRWSAINEKYRRDNMPDRNAEYLFYQTLVGAWPLPEDRALGYMQKAAREAKQHTRWMEPNENYENALADFVKATLADAEFQSELEKFVTPIIEAGRINSLAQALLKMTTPGVPDFYQGTELWDLSLVDPDNRRPVDFDARRAALAKLRARLTNGPNVDLIRELSRNSGDGLIKMLVTHLTLKLRRERARLFERGRYVPLFANGRKREHVCAFARVLETEQVIVIASRLICGLTPDPLRWPTGEASWGDTMLVLRGVSTVTAYRNVFTGQRCELRRAGANAELPLAQVLDEFPLALLEPEA